jgi:hypothetical protein
VIIAQATLFYVSQASLFFNKFFRFDVLTLTPQAIIIKENTGAHIMSQAIRIWVEFKPGQKSFVQWGKYTVALDYRQAESLVRTLGLANKAIFHPVSQAYDLYYTQGVYNA